MVFKDEMSRDRFKSTYDSLPNEPQYYTVVEDGAAPCLSPDHRGKRARMLLVADQDVPFLPLKLKASAVVHVGLPAARTGAAVEQRMRFLAHGFEGSGTGLTMVFLMGIEVPSRALVAIRPLVRTKDKEALEEQVFERRRAEDEGKLEKDVGLCQDYLTTSNCQVLRNYIIY